MYNDTDIDKRIGRLKTIYPSVKPYAKLETPIILLMSNQRGYDFTLGIYDLATEEIKLNWNALKNHCERYEHHLDDIIVHVLSHEYIHYILHRDFGLSTTVKFDNLAGTAPGYGGGNFNGID